MTVTAGLDMVPAVARSGGDDRLLSQLLGANAGALFVLFAYTRRLRAARAGRKLEQHFLYRAAPYHYIAGWMLPIGFAVALIRRGNPSLAAVALLVSFLAIWCLSGIVLRRDWRIERQGVAHEPSRSRTR